MKVAVVDPDRATYDSIAHELDAVRWFPDAESFLAELDRSDPPRAIVAEAHLPGVDGVALIGALRERGCAAPVVIVCENADVSTAVRAIRNGAADFLEKPLFGAALASCLRRLGQTGIADPHKSRIV
ncbi:MAG TPA: response regulator [Gammaproteobacteria bacterium]